MRKTIVFLAASLAACHAEQPAQNQAANVAVPAAPAAPAAPSPPPAPSPAPAPAPSDANAVPAIDKTPAAAKAVLDDYFAALATRQYARAYAMWSGGGQASGMSEAEFAASFAKYKIYDGRAFGAGDMEGAAGSSYIEFPVTVTGILAKGGGFHLSGPMTLRRVNDVDGSTAEQRRWHIASNGLKPGP